MTEPTTIPRPSLNDYQRQLASGVFIETMCELAKHRINHGKLEGIADELSSALCVGLAEINAVEPVGLDATQLAQLDQAFSDATAALPATGIRVLSVNSSGGPAHYPRVSADQSKGYLNKAATKLNTTNDLPRFLFDVFSCGWPDVAITFCLCGPLEKHIPSLSLQVALLDPENPRRPGGSSNPPAHSCSSRSGDTPRPPHSQCP
ncbi:hypothetical protein R0J87_12590 [Halomonas sp. SIMBA_159]